MVFFRYFAGVMKRCVIIHAYHNDNHFARDIAASYIAGAKESGTEIREIKLDELQFGTGLITTENDLPVIGEDIKAVIQSAKWSNHLIIIVDVNKSQIPLRLQSFIDRLFITNAYTQPHPAFWGNDHGLNVKTARIISMLDSAAWTEFRADGVAKYHPLHASRLTLLGFQKVRTTTIAPVYNGVKNAYYKKWIYKMHELGTILN